MAWPFPHPAPDGSGGPPLHYHHLIKVAALSSLFQDHKKIGKTPSKQPGSNRIGQRDRAKTTIRGAQENQKNIREETEIHRAMSSFFSAWLPSTAALPQCDQVHATATATGPQIEVDPLISTLPTPLPPTPETSSDPMQVLDLSTSPPSGLLASPFLAPPTAPTSAESKATTPAPEPSQAEVTSNPKPAARRKLLNISAATSPLQIRKKYPDRVPVVCSFADDVCIAENLLEKGYTPILLKQKYLVPKTSTWETFIVDLRERIQMETLMIGDASAETKQVTRKLKALPIDVVVELYLNNGEPLKDVEEKVGVTDARILPTGSDCLPIVIRLNSLWATMSIPNIRIKFPQHAVVVCRTKDNDKHATAILKLTKTDFLLPKSSSYAEFFMDVRRNHLQFLDKDQKCSDRADYALISFICGGQIIPKQTQLIGEMDQEFFHNEGAWDVLFTTECAFGWGPQR